MNDPVEIQIKIHDLENKLAAQSQLIIELASKVNGLEKRLYAHKKPNDGKYAEARPGKKITEGQLKWLNSELAKRDSRLEKKILDEYQLGALDRIEMNKFNEIMERVKKVPLK